MESVLKGEHPKLKELLTENEWKSVLSEEMEKPSFAKLQAFLEAEWDDPKHVVYPPVRFVFEAFHQTPFDKSGKWLNVSQSEDGRLGCEWFYWAKTRIMDRIKQQG